jgi:hypothetical protein
VKEQIESQIGAIFVELENHKIEGIIMTKKKYTKTKMFIDCLDEIFGKNGEKLRGEE